MGIHQIRGKVGERSYYKTKGVESGISRSINQGLSARVKSAEEYANTRLNNAEFKNANAIATAAFKSVNTRNRGMMRNFAIAEMTKAALDAIKQGTGDWGSRKPNLELDALIVDMLENHAKGGVYDGKFGIFSDISLSNAGSYSFTVALDEAGVDALIAEGIDGLYFVPSKCLAGEVLVDDAQRLYAGYAVGTPENETLSAGVDFSETYTGSVNTPSSVGMSPAGYTFATGDVNHGFYLVVTILPYRQQGGKRYTLQEMCTFVALPLGQIPE